MLTHCIQKRQFLKEGEATKTAACKHEAFFLVGLVFFITFITFMTGTDCVGFFMGFTWCFLCLACCLGTAFFTNLVSCWIAAITSADLIVVVSVKQLKVLFNSCRGKRWRWLCDGALMHHACPKDKQLHNCNRHSE